MTLYDHEDTQNRLRWAINSLGAMKDGRDPPPPPQSIAREKWARERARRRRRERIENGEFEDIPFEERCVGLGPICIHCNEPLPDPGEGPRRCEGGEGR